MNKAGPDDFRFGESQGPAGSWDANAAVNFRQDSSMDFETSYDLVHTLKDPSHYSYDDPLLNQSLNVIDDTTNGAKIYPMKNIQQLISTSHMPGAFESSPDDGMDLDAPATFNVDAFAEGGIPNFNQENNTDNFSGAKNAFVHQEYASPSVEAQNGSMLRSGSFQVPNDFTARVDYGDMPQPPNSDTPRHFQEPNLPVYNSSGNGASFQSPSMDYSPNTTDDSQKFYSQMSAAPQRTPPGIGVSAEWRDTASHRTSISAAGHDLSPLTTTTSFTPSVNSLHSTQPSFFSAQQFLRTSFDQPPSSVSRVSMDLYSRRRQSIESSNSGINAPARSQRSFASYFHFRDRDRKSPIPRDNYSPPSCWPQNPSSQHRQSIRSIFRANENAPEIDFENLPYDPQAYLNDFHKNGVLDPEQFAEPEGSAQKKSKKNNRGLFTRFKPAKVQDSAEFRPDSPKPDELKTDSWSSSDLIKEEQDRSDPSSLKNSAQASSQYLLPKTSGSLKNVDSAGSMQGENFQEPDYAALFTNVGKRRNLVGIKNKKKSDVVVKVENDVEINALTASLSSNDNSAEIISAGSLPISSQQFFNSKDSGPSDTPASGSAFANASKRILGSRLMKKKSSALKLEQPQSNVVEVDLRSLDIPMNVEILETNDSTTRTRGRKENKAADMVDQSKIFVCGFCDRRFKRQEHLKRHFRSLHTKEKPYNCDICQKKFSRADNLNQHLKIHRPDEVEATILES